MLGNPCGRAWPYAFASLCALVSAYAAGLYIATLGGAVRIGAATPPLAHGLQSQASAIYLHALCSAVALMICGLQMLPAFRRTASVRIHRLLGWAYVCCVAIGSATGAALSRTATGGAVATAGFALLAAAWASTTGAAIYAMRTGRPALHARLMSHSAALCFAAVTLRMYLPAAIFAPQISRGATFEGVYCAIAWLCWIPNTLAVELYYFWYPGVAHDLPASTTTLPEAAEKLNPSKAIAPDTEHLRGSY